MLVKVITTTLSELYSLVDFLCHANTSILLTSIIQRYAIVVWGVQDENLENATIIVWMR